LPPVEETPADHHPRVHDAVSIAVDFEHGRAPGGQLCGLFEALGFHQHEATHVVDDCQRSLRQPPRLVRSLRRIQRLQRLVIPGQIAQSIAALQLRIRPQFVPRRRIVSIDRQHLGDRCRLVRYGQAVLRILLPKVPRRIAQHAHHSDRVQLRLFGQGRALQCQRARHDAGQVLVRFARFGIHLLRQRDQVLRRRRPLACCSHEPRHQRRVDLRVQQLNEARHPPARLAHAEVRLDLCVPRTVFRIVQVVGDLQLRQVSLVHVFPSIRPPSSSFARRRHFDRICHAFCSVVPIFSAISFPE